MSVAQLENGELALTAVHPAELVQCHQEMLKWCDRSCPSDRFFIMSS